MGDAESSGASELLQAQAQVFNDTLAYTRSMSLKCAVELGIPDAIHRHGRPITAAELSAALNLPSSKTPFLRRLIRLLCNMGYLTEEDEDRYSLTPCSRILVRDRPTSLAWWVKLLLNPVFIEPFQCWNSWFSEGNNNKMAANPMETAHGMSFWEIMSRNSEFKEIFNVALAGDTRVVMQAMIAECKEAFEGVGSVVDVGGGDGTCARAIVDAFPNIKCTVYDLPHVIATVPMAARVDAVGGDMFKHVPKADAVFMKHIMHSWTDEECVKILKRCREAIPEERGKVIIVDIVVNKTGQEEEDSSLIHETGLFWDMLMMICTTGRERDEGEWKRLFDLAGFSKYKITSLGLRSLFEVFP